MTLTQTQQDISSPIKNVAEVAERNESKLTSDDQLNGIFSGMGLNGGNPTEGDKVSLGLLWMERSSDWEMRGSSSEGI